MVENNPKGQDKDLLFKDYAGQVEAIGKSQAVISFNMDGTIITANDNFLEAMGYGLDEIQGQHHRMFVEPSDRDSNEYKEFWEALNRGEYRAAEYKRIGKGGREVWIQATYNPILDLNGTPFKVVKYATDVTQQKLHNADFSGQVEAIGKSQAVIAFNMDGTIITANDNFLEAMGYGLDEIQGQHHRMFVEPSDRDSDEYKEFWEALNRGEYRAAEYKRIGKGGREVWIQASYNPILDLNKKPFKVVKYATDITQRVLDEKKIREQSRTIREISTPAIKLWDRIVVLPVVGVIDSMRAQQIMTAMLSKITETSSKIIILDIQGVAAVDTAVANHLIKITKATKLMGCECIISGISSAVAQTLVQLGIDLGDVVTNSTLEDALQEAFKVLKYEVRTDTK